jgi:isobutyryl-CoA mutase
MKRFLYFGTIASQFNDPGHEQPLQNTDGYHLRKTKADLHSSYKHFEEQSQKIFIIPPERVRYLSEITETVRSYGKWAVNQSK